MFHIEQLATIVFWLAVSVVAIDLAMVLYVFYRRAIRRRYYRLKDRARTRYAGALAKFSEDATVLAELRGGRTRAERDAIEDLLLTGINDGNRRQRTYLLMELGFVAAWSRQGFGARAGHRLLRAAQSGSAISPPPVRFRRLKRLRAYAVPRALAVNRLGLLTTEHARFFLEQALLDASPVVQRTAVIAMGRNRDPRYVPALLQQLEHAVEGRSDVAIRPIKTALVRYSIDAFRNISRDLDHSNARLRFLLVDSIREICRRSAPAVRREDFPADLLLWFLERAALDTAADVRARSAQVIGTFRDEGAKQALRKLLRDENEFVRLHAVRTCSDPFYSDLATDLAERVTDTRWRVREAATLALATFGEAGKRKLSDLLLSTPDRYASEQIADLLQRTGALDAMVSGLQSWDGEGRTAMALCTTMVRLGKSSLLSEMVLRKEKPEVRSLLLDALITAPTPNTLATLRRIAEDSTDELRTKAEMLLKFHDTRAAFATGGTGQD